MTNAIDFIICGPLRGGTTMLRLMINNHPGLANAGEFDYLFRHCHMGPNGVRIDRESLSHTFGFSNFGLTLDPALDDTRQLESFLEQIAARKPGIQSINIHHDIDKVRPFLPKARIVKLHRDPRDVARSSIPMGFAGTVYRGVEHWIHTERAWDRLRPTLDEGDYMELRFEDLVSDPPKELARLCAFMGVPYDGAMLDYADSSTYEAPDAGVAFKWKRSMPPAQAALVAARAPALIRSRGYEVPDNARLPGAAGRAWLQLADKVALYRFNFRRFGLGTVLAEKVTRRLGLRRLHGRIMDRRINPIIRTIVK